jgi:hypothetical protein
MPIRIIFKRTVDKFLLELGSIREEWKNLEC